MGNGICADNFVGHILVGAMPHAPDSYFARRDGNHTCLNSATMNDSEAVFLDQELLVKHRAGI